MAVGDWYRLSVEMLSANSNDVIVNTFAYRQENDLILDEAGEDLVQAWINDGDPNHRSCFSAAVAVQRFEVRGLTDPTYVYEQAITPLNGSNAGDCLPQQVAALISWRTGMAGRRHRGRTYLPPTSEGNQVQGRVTAGYLSALDNLVSTIVLIGDGIATSFWQLGVWSTVNEAGREVTSGIPRTILATQRRRREGVGA